MTDRGFSRRGVVRGAVVAFALAALFFAANGAVIVVDGLNDRLGKADIGVVLGNEVQRDGQPAPGLAGRLDEALILYRQGYFPRVMVSGAVERDSGFAEGTVMRDYLVAHGVPDAAVIVDNHGDDTHLTALNLARYMRAHGLKRALAVSQYYHMPRTRLALHRCGVDPVYTAHAWLFTWKDPLFVMREAVGYPYYWLVKGHCSPD